MVEFKERLFLKKIISADYKAVAGLEARHSNSTHQEVIVYLSI